MVAHVSGREHLPLPVVAVVVFLRVVAGPYRDDVARAAGVGVRDHHSQAVEEADRGLGQLVQRFVVGRPPPAPLPLTHGSLLCVLALTASGSRRSDRSSSDASQRG